MEEDALLFEDFIKNDAVGVNIRRHSPISLDYRPMERSGLMYPLVPSCFWYELSVCVVQNEMVRLDEQQSPTVVTNDCHQPFITLTSHNSHTLIQKELENQKQ